MVGSPGSDKWPRLAGVRFSSGLVQLSPDRRSPIFLDKGDKIVVVHNTGAADAGADDDSHCSGMAAV
jgi:hypothetical protein